MLTPVEGSRQGRVARLHLWGFSLIEVVVALAVIFILAAVALPELNGYLDQKRIDATATQLANVRDALNKAASNAFFQKVGKNAGRLSELDSSLVPLDATWVTGTDDSCGGTFSAAQRTNWNNNGPFVNFLIEKGVGMQTPIGRTADSLTRTPPAGGAGTLRITFISNVTFNDAQMLDETIDATNGSATGTVQWTAPVNGIVNLYYFVPIGASC